MPVYVHIIPEIRLGALGQLDRRLAVDAPGSRGGRYLLWLMSRSEPYRVGVAARMLNFLKYPSNHKTS